MYEITIIFYLFRKKKYILAFNIIILRVGKILNEYYFYLNRTSRIIIPSG